MKCCFCIKIILFLLYFFEQNTYAQKTTIPEDSSFVIKSLSPFKRTTVHARVIDGDTLPIVTLKEFAVYTPKAFKNEREAKRYARLLRDVKKAYPYAKIAGKKLKEYNSILSTFKTEKERKLFLKEAEEAMKKEFENDLKNLTLTQGRILIKLVDRETGNSSYELIKDLKGSFSAFMWQSLARMFGSSLKDKYDPKGEDKMIEEILILIESGEI